MMNAARLCSLLPKLRLVKINPHPLLHAPLGSAIALVERAFASIQSRSSDAPADPPGFDISRWEIDKYPPNADDIALSQAYKQIVGNIAKIEGRRATRAERDDEEA